jgi:two-component system phosphate regulon sensor histidine kinase PhoR
VDQDIVASLPLGLLVGIGIALMIVGGAAGWLLAHSRMRRRAARGAFNRARLVGDLLDALPQPAFLADADARILAQNREAAQLLKAIGQGDDLPLAVDAAVGRAIRSRIAETLEIPSPVNPARRMQAVVSALDSHEALVLFADPNAGSGRAELYQHLIGQMAHELRTPLTAITGHVDIMNSCQVEEEAMWRRSLGFVSGEAERLTRLVEDLLSLSRLDRIPLNTHPMNVRAAAEEAISTLFEAAERNKVSLVLQSPPELPRVLADPDRIRQVFLNLLDNGIKYAPGGTVTVRLTPEAEMMRVEASDTGPGIASEDLPRLFEPFYRGTRADPGSRGAGLGLTIVRAILNQHNAPIQVHSAPDQGTTIAFSLPMAR